MSQYFVQRGEKIHGPFSSKQLKSGLESGKLKETDLMSDSKAGPWRNVVEEFQEPAPAEKSPQASTGSKPAEGPSGVIDGPQQNLPQSTTPSPAPKTKKCKYCAEDILVDAIKCKFCGEMLDRDSSPESGDHAATGSQVAMLEQQAQVQLRTKNYKLAEDTFQQLINLDISNIRGWLGKAKAIAHQTYFGSPDSLLKHFRTEDRSEEALLCIQMAQEQSGSVAKSAEIEKAKADVIEISVAELLKGSKSVVDTCLGSLTIRHNPFAAGIKKGFLNKPLQALTRCLELSPDRPEARSYYLRVCAELRIQPAFFGFGTEIDVLQVKDESDFELRIHGQYSLVFMVACEAIVHTTRWVSSEEHFEKGSVVGRFHYGLAAVVRVVIDLETVGDGWVTLRFKGTMPGKPIDWGIGEKKAKEVIKSLKQFALNPEKKW